MACQVSIGDISRIQLVSGHKNWNVLQRYVNLAEAKPTDCWKDWRWKMEVLNYAVKVRAQPDLLKLSFRLEQASTKKNLVSKVLGLSNICPLGFRGKRRIFLCGQTTYNPKANQPIFKCRMNKDKS